jgi:NAD(P)-dependent dehydrogenase (short-subunit alcohol dehydrogenase family)
MDLSHKIAVVTGASSGLGRRFAVDFAKAGAVVTGLARREDQLCSLGEEMRQWSAESSTVVCDVTEIAAFARTLAEVESHHGRIDVLVNNAGMNAPHGIVEDLSSYRSVMETNYFAAVAGTLTVLPGMRRRGNGIVVNVSSDSGRAPGPLEIAYGASKAALSAFTESIALELGGSGIHVHLLYPAWVPTAMGTAAVEAGMPTPPRAVRRSEAQVSRLLISRMGEPKIDIDAAFVARLAPMARLLFPRLYKRGVRKAAGK